MATSIDNRIRVANDKPINHRGQYVLYWMQATRRLHDNHSLDYAIAQAVELNVPIVVYEGLRRDYPWAAARHHRFIMDGMVANAKKATELGINYWPYIETLAQPARGLLRKLAGDACMVVTDDYPAFIVPGQIAALARHIEVPVIAIDSNNVIPLKALGEAVAQAAFLRHRIHRLFADAWKHRAAKQVDIAANQRKKIDPPFEIFDPTINLDSFISTLQIDMTVPAIPGVVGGVVAGQKELQSFVEIKLGKYANHRGKPDSPDSNAASRLSPYLRHGHLAIEEIIAAVLGPDWLAGDIDISNRGKRQGFFDVDENVNSYLDEAITWRSVGYHWWYCRQQQGLHQAPIKTENWPFPHYADLETTLPSWAIQTLKKHATDARSPLYNLEELEAGETQDKVWNAAQRELVATGRIHNYLRMLWGKKVLEWSESPEIAYRTLEHLNNKYAIDGRDPNSYTGILWCFGLFDRPWFPERPIFGTVRYMSSDNTGRKFKLQGYYDYIDTLPTPREVWAGRTAARKKGLFDQH